MKHFESPAECIEYIQRELVDTLEEDHRKMCREEYQFYDDADREEMQNRIDDCKAVISTYPWVVPV